mmetsp:Transcript_39166/g.123463  ORF Transcript_39166/g.123463 Transcript_39166/m.123463 type:complete len:172 (+) Transcript_39166:3133-3648(+)
MLHKRNMFETRLSDYRCHCSNCLLHACSPAPSHQLYPSLLPPSVFGFSAAFCLVYLKCLQAKHVKPSEPEAPLSAERGSEANPYEKPRHGPMRRRLEGYEHGQSPFASNEKMSIANGFSHNQKLAKDNPYAQRGSGLNNNQNHIFDNLRGYPPRDPYMFEVQRARQMRGNQ